MLDRWATGPGATTSGEDGIDGLLERAGLLRTARGPLLGLGELGADEQLVKAAMALDAKRFDPDAGLVWTPQFRDIEALSHMIELVGERAAVSLFISNLHEQIEAGKVQQAEGAAVARMLDEADEETVKSYSAATDNVGLFFGEDIFIAIGSIILIQQTFATYGINLAPLELAVWAIPTAIFAFLIHGARLLLLDRRLARKRP